jgi:hypothetical protein
MDPQELITQLFSGLRASQQGRAQSMQDLIAGAMGPIDAQQAPGMIPVPGVASPFGSMASTFAATLADQLGARGSMAMNEQRLAEQQEAQRQTQHANYARQEAFDREKTAQKLGQLMKLQEAKMKMYDEQGDLDKYEATLKANFATAEKLKRMDAEAAQEKLKTRGTQILKEIEARGKVKSELQKEASSLRESITKKYGESPLIKVKMKKLDNQDRAERAAMQSKWAEFRAQINTFSMSEEEMASRRTALEAEEGALEAKIAQRWSELEETVETEKAKAPVTSVTTQSSHRTSSPLSKYAK